MLALGTVLVGAADGCGGGGSDDSSGAAAPSFGLPVLDILPLSGDLSALGQSGQKAADLAVSQVRATITRLNAKQAIAITHVDDRGNAATAVSAARAAAQKRAPACITGSWLTGTTVGPLKQVAIPGGILQITPAATSDELTSIPDQGLLQRTVLPDHYEGRATADVIDEDVGGAGGRTVSVGAENTSYGKGIAADFVKAWRAKGGEVVGPVAYAPAAPSYGDVAAKIAPAGKDVDAYALFGGAQSYQKLSAALLATGRWSPGNTYVPDALATRSLPAAAGAAAVEGLRGVAPGSPEGTPATEAFDRLYDRAPGPKRQAFDAQQFDAVLLCYLAAVKVGSANGRAMASAVRQISGPPGQKFTWEQLPQAAQALAQGKDIDYDGASGPIDLDGAGDPTVGAYDLFRFKSGRLEVYDQVSVGTPASG
jgi:ABC-type branched-subunit amino acid transport system substrate-binding protein